MKEYTLIGENKTVVGTISRVVDYTQFTVVLLPSFQEEYTLTLKEMLAGLIKEINGQMTLDNLFVSNSNRLLWEAFVQDLFRHLTIVVEVKN